MATRALRHSSANIWHAARVTMLWLIHCMCLIGCC